MKLKLDKENFEVDLDGNKTPLSKTEYSVFSYLFANKHKYVSQKELIKTVWGSNKTSASHVPYVVIFNLRKNIHNDIIINRRGIGWKINPIFFE